VNITPDQRRSIHLKSVDGSFGELDVPLFLEFLSERPSEEALIPHLEATRLWLKEQESPGWATYVLGSLAAFYKEFSSHWDQAVPHLSSSAGSSP